MTIFERFKKWRRGRLVKAALAAGLAVPDRGGAGGRGTRRVTWLRGDYTLYNSELLFSAVSRIANALSSMPVQLYRDSRPATWHELYDLVGFSPNPNMTSCQFFRTMEACRDTAGNAYALKIYDADGELARLDVLDPSCVTPVLETDSRELWYRVRDRETGRELYVHNFYVLHVPFLCTNGYTGINPVSVLYDTMQYAESIQKFSLELLEKGMNASVVLEAPANLGEAQKKAMIADFMDTYDKTSGNILLLESGVTAKALNLSPVDSKLFEVEKITRSKVAMVYNLPPHLLGDYSDTSFASQEQQMLEFLMLTMLPIVTAYEQELNRKLLTQRQRRAGYRFVFDMEAILRADAATQAEVDYKQVRSGISTIDEARARHGMPALPNKLGSVALVSQDLAPLEYTVRTKPLVLARTLERGGDGETGALGGEGDGGGS